jgi:hypothetical protein
MKKKNKTIKLKKSELINDMMDMGYHPDDFDEILDEHIDSYKTLPKKLMLYRVIYADSIGDINIDEPGRHYSWDKNNLINNHVYASGYGNHKYIITVEADKDLIDAQETISKNIRYPNESEITLLHNGFGVEVLEIEEI